MRASLSPALLLFFSLFCGAHRGLRSPPPLGPECLSSSSPLRMSTTSESVTSSSSPSFLFFLSSPVKKIIIIIKSLLSGNFAVRVELESCPVSEVFEGLKKVSKFPHAAFTLVCGRRSRLPSRSLPGFPDGSAPLLQTFVFLCCLRARYFSPLASKPPAPVVVAAIKNSSVRVKINRFKPS